jgi:hypothetical protein
VSDDELRRELTRMVLGYMGIAPAGPEPVAPHKRRRR